MGGLWRRRQWWVGVGIVEIENLGPVETVPTLRLLIYHARAGGGGGGPKIPDVRTPYGVRSTEYPIAQSSLGAALCRLGVCDRGNLRVETLVPPTVVPYRGPVFLFFVPASPPINYQAPGRPRVTNQLPYSRFMCSLPLGLALILALCLMPLLD